MEILRSTFVTLVLVVGVVKGQIPFSLFYEIEWGGNHATIMDNETRVELLLDESSGGAGFHSKYAYLSGFFHIRMKLPENKSPGIITTFYLLGERNSGRTSSMGHNEIDFEFLSTTDSTVLHTNIFANDSGNREQRVHLWFDPTTDFHSYDILWNAHLIVFYVDDIPIRVFKNGSKEGANFPTGLMKVEASIWNGTWAGTVDWTKGPFKAQYEDFYMLACTELTSPAQCASPSFVWNQILELNPKQREDYENIRKNFLVYDYCTDRPQKECQLPNY